jgi:hypothetical protein
MQTEVSARKQALLDVPGSMRSEVAALRDEAWRLDLYAQLEQLKGWLPKWSLEHVQTDANAGPILQAKDTLDNCILEQASMSGTADLHASCKLDVPSEEYACAPAGIEDMHTDDSTQNSGVDDSECPSVDAGVAKSEDAAGGISLIDILKAEEDEAAEQLADMMMQVEVRLPQTVEQMKNENLLEFKEVAKTC